MSSTIKYGRLNDYPFLPISRRSTWLQKMQDVFGDPPWIISEKNLTHFATLNKILHEDEVIDMVMKKIEDDGCVEIDYTILICPTLIDMWNSALDEAKKLFT